MKRKEIEIETPIGIKDAVALFNRSRDRILADCWSRKNRVMGFAKQDCVNGKWDIYPSRYQKYLDRR